MVSKTVVFEEEQKYGTGATVSDRTGFEREYALLYLPSTTMIMRLRSSKRAMSMARRLRAVVGA